MPNPQIAHPSRAVPFIALSYGDPGAPAVAVSPDNPLPGRERPYRGARAISPDILIAPGEALAIDCATAGTVALELADGSALTLSFPAGVAILPLAVRRVVAAASSASFSAWALD